jgi:hypothetical protein
MYRYTHGRRRLTCLPVFGLMASAEVSDSIIEQAAAQPTTPLQEANPGKGHWSLLQTGRRPAPGKRGPSSAIAAGALRMTLQ